MSRNATSQSQIKSYDTAVTNLYRILWDMFLLSYQDIVFKDKLWRWVFGDQRGDCHMKTLQSFPSFGK